MSRSKKSIDRLFAAEILSGTKYQLDNIASNLEVDKVGGNIKTPKKYVAKCLSDAQYKEWQVKLEIFNELPKVEHDNKEGVNWFGTINNPGKWFENPEEFCSIIKDLGYVDCLIYQLEIGQQTGTPHYQFYMHLTTKKIWSAIMHEVERVAAQGDVKGFIMSYLAPMFPRSSPVACFNYCSKLATRVDGPWGFGHLEKGTTQGSRNEFEKIRESLLKEGRITKEMKCSATYVKHGDWYKEQLRDCRQEKFDELQKQWFMENPLTQVQQIALNYVLEQGNREACALIDVIGSIGKSLLGDFLRIFYGAFVTNTGESRDMFEAYDGQDIVVIDLPRETKMEELNYAIIEQLKAGRINKTKYRSSNEVRSSVKVLVVANNMPMRSKMTADRWTVISVSEKGIIDIDEAPVWKRFAHDFEINEKSKEILKGKAWYSEVFKE